MIPAVILSRISEARMTSSEELTSGAIDELSSAAEVAFVQFPDRNPSVVLLKTPILNYSPEQNILTCTSYVLYYVFVKILEVPIEMLA